MQSIRKLFTPLPTNDDPDPKKIEKESDKPDGSDSLNSDGDMGGESEHKSFKTSLRDALQEWSNDDARDIEEDDSTPLRSGL